MQKFRRMLAATACLVVGVASFALSFVALTEVSIAVGAVPASMGWLVPIVIDGGVICGSAVIWSAAQEADERPLFPFVFVGALVLVSVVVNIAHAEPNLLARGIAALPPLILLGTLELVASQGRRARAVTVPHTAAHPAAQPAAQPAAEHSVAPQQGPTVTTPATTPQLGQTPEQPAADTQPDAPVPARPRTRPAAAKKPAPAKKTTSVKKSAATKPATPRPAAAAARSASSSRPVRVAAAVPATD